MATPNESSAFPTSSALRRRNWTMAAMSSPPRTPRLAGDIPHAIRCSCADEYESTSVFGREPVCCSHYWVSPPLYQILILAMRTTSLQYLLHMELEVPLLVKQRRWRSVRWLQPMSLWFAR
uniref:Uncharacterized protein n=1 Tax=Hyaloperonospora arabidopsidis (strain Emoy2) TaxID=559515 RepID=M4BU47_HYAAE